jgi:hypothetical protein
LSLYSRCKKVPQNAAFHFDAVKNFAGVLSWLIVFSTTLTGCSYFFGTQARPPAIEIKQNSAQCLSELKANMKSWASTGAPSMDQQIDCIVGGIDQFTKQTSGRSGDGWSKAELAGFFDTYFPSKDGESSVRWIEPILKLKQSWFGGIDDRITRVELARVRGFLLLVKPEMAALSPSAPSLFLKDVKTADGSNKTVEAEFVSQHLKRVGERILDEIAQTPNLKTTYSVESILELLMALRVIEPGSERAQARRSALVEGLKDLAVGGSPRLVTAEEWSRLIPTLTSAWGLAIRLKFQMLRTPIVSDDSYELFASFANEALDVLRTAVASQGDEGLRYKKIEDLLETYATDQDGNVGRIEIANSKIRVSTLQGLLPLLFERLLVDRSATPLRSSSMRDMRTKRVRLEHMTALAKLVADGLAGQRVVSAVYGSRVGLDTKSIRRGLQTPLAHEAVIETRAREQLIELLGAGRIPIRDEASRPTITATQNQPEMTKAAASHYNLARVIVTALFRAYATDRQNPDRLNQASIEKIYWDIREVGLDFNMIDVRNKGSAPRTFLEASIFTSVSRGDETVSIGEVVEWYHVALGASNVGDKIYRQLEAVCSTGEPDVYGRTKIRLECLRRNFWEDLKRNLPNLPGLVAYYESASAADQAEFRKSVEDAGRPLGSASNRSVDSSEVRSIVPILHYTESLMMNHDVNGDGILDTEEVWKAYPTFRGLIGQMAGENKPELLKKTVFSYLLTFGAPPTPGFFGNAGMLAWLVAKTLWSESADRLKVLKIIASFSVVGRQKKQEALENYLAKIDRKLPDVLSSQESSKDLVEFAEAFGCRAEFHPGLAESFRAAAAEVSRRVGAHRAQFMAEMKNVILQNPDFDLRCDSF